MNKIFFFLSIIFIHIGILSQQNPVTWKIEYHKDNSLIKYKTSIEYGWHLYAANLPSPDEGPLPTEFNYNDSDKFKLSGAVFESKSIEEFDENFGVDVRYFENSAEFSQKIELTSSEPFPITGTIYYMVCNDQMCIPFEDPFEVMISP